jgi:hypothetical protein
MPQLNERIQTLLLPAYSPCESLDNACGDMSWYPDRGHVPRGFCGATGSLDEVGLVLITAEPGDPHDSESHLGNSPKEIFDSAYDYCYRCLEQGTDLFHRNIRLILDLCFPGEAFPEQMRRVWITDSVLCSAKIECSGIPKLAAEACRSRYLEAQINLFPEAIIATLGAKARNRLSGLARGYVVAGAAAPPGCNRAGARESWKAIADRIQAKFG